MNRRWAHAEALANTIIGTIMGQLILFVFGMPLLSAIALNVTMIVLSYLRAYALRRIFQSYALRRISQQVRA